MSSGWVCVHRQLLDNPIFKNHKLLQVFMYLLLKASHSDHSQLVGDQIVELKPGQIVTGRKSISAATGLTEQNVRTALIKLEKLGILTSKSTNKYSVITMVNWHSYQQPNQHPTSIQPASNQQVTTNNNVNNGNNGNKDSERASRTPVPYKKISESYNRIAEPLGLAMVKVDYSSKARKANLKKIWEFCERDMDVVDRMFDFLASKLDGKPFYRGENDRGWVASIDWVAQDKTLTKINEGGIA